MTEWTIDEFLEIHDQVRFQNGLPRHELRRVWPGGERVNLAQVLDLGIADDAIVAVLSTGPRDLVLKVAEKSVERTVRTYALPCNAAKEWASKWLAGDEDARSCLGCNRTAYWLHGDPYAKNAVRAACELREHQENQPLSVSVPWAIFQAVAMGNHRQIEREFERQVADFRLAISQGVV